MVWFAVVWHLRLRYAFWSTTVHCPGHKCSISFLCFFLRFAIVQAFCLVFHIRPPWVILMRGKVHSAFWIFWSRR